MLPVNIVLVLLGFTALIVVHELGHYLAAKWAGIRVEGFAIGMGPVVAAYRRGIGLTRGSTDPGVHRLTGKHAAALSDEELRSHGLSETEWSLRLLPLGGFVKMLGQDDLHPTTTATGARSYMAAPVGRRMVVVSAGVIANALLAVALFMVAFLVGVRFEAPVIGAVAPDSPAASATVEVSAPSGSRALEPGLRPGDRIVAIDGSPARTFSDIDIAAAMGSPARASTLHVERPGVNEALEVTITPVFEPSMGRLIFGVMPARSTTLSTESQLALPLEAALRESGLADAGVTAGMTLQSLAGAEVQTRETLEGLVAASGGEPIASTWRGPDGAIVSAAMSPLPDLEIVRVPPEGEDAREEVVQALIGLVPLVRIDAIDSKSRNIDHLRVGDVVLRVASTGESRPPALAAPRRAEFLSRIQASAGDTLELEVLRDGAVERVEASVDRNGRLGVILGPALEIPRTARPVQQVRGADGDQPSPLAGVGVLGGSTIGAIDGAPVRDWVDLWRGVRAAVEHSSADDGATIELTITPPLDGARPERVVVVLTAQDVERLRALGWQLPIADALFEPLATLLTADGNPLRAIGMGFRETHKMIVTTYLTIYGLINRTVGVDQLRGPVGIVHLGTAVMERGWPYLLFFLAMISANLAVLNFLPLPIVDGGLFLNLVYEKLRGVPPPMGFQNAATLVGLCLIAGLFLMTFYFDVMRLVQ